MGSNGVMDHDINEVAGVSLAVDDLRRRALVAAGQEAVDDA
jgi:hypothetical protein